MRPIHFVVAMLYLSLLLLGAVLLLASERIAQHGLRTLVFVAGEAVFGGVVFASLLGVLRKVIAVLRSDSKEER